MFATLLEPAAFSSRLEGRIAAVASLGGPYITSDVKELAAAHAAGLQVALLIRDDGQPDLAKEVAHAATTGAEIIAIRTSALAATHSDRGVRLARLAGALTAGAGRHRMLICTDLPLAPLSAAEWARLSAESLLIDPIADPDAWRAAATMPGDRGLVLALVGAPGAPAEAREVLLWGLRYAASLGGRGGARVGFTERPHPLASARADADRAGAARTIAILVDLLRLTAADAATLHRELDPRSISPAASRLGVRRRGGADGG